MTPDMTIFGMCAGFALPGNAGDASAACVLCCRCFTFLLHVCTDWLAVCASALRVCRFLLQECRLSAPCAVNACGICAEYGAGCE